MVTFISLDHYLTFWIKNGVDFSFAKLILYISYCGPALGILLAYKLSRMKDLTFFNQMFFFYFCVDSFVGFLQTFSLEKLQRDK